MEMKLPLLYTFLSVALAISHAALPSVEYWNSKLPGSPMPKVVKDLLQNEWVDDKSTVVRVGKGGVGTDGPTALVYYAAAETQLRDNPNVALLFLEKDLHQDKTLNLEFAKTTNPGALLPRNVAASIPFSSKYTPEIFEKFSVKPGSKLAKIIKKTLQECEQPGIRGEEKFCATSLESMIDFSASKLGYNIQAISTDAHGQTQKQTYTISGAKKVDRGGEAVVCHEQNYPYAVFYCHKTGKTDAFSVTLVGENGEKIEAVAVCHKDTSAWNPKHLAFQVLNVKPGTLSVCHFLPENHIVWVRKRIGVEIT